MNETFSATDKSCPNCGGIVAADSRFCKHCAFDFAAPPQALPQTSAPGDSAPGKNRYVWPALGLAAVLALAVAAAWFYKSRHSAAPAAAAAPSQVMTDKAKQVEARILQGATVANAELAGLSSYELRVLRNVHFARYGRVYDRPGLGDYYATRGWYKPSGDYNDKLLTATDKANISVILAEENNAKAAEAAQAASVAATATPASKTGSASLGFSSNSELTTDKVQRAVEGLLDWTRKGGGARVIGIQEVPQENMAKADIRFEEFQYNSDGLGTPVSKNQLPPREPDINSPSFYEDMAKYSTQKVKVTSYSGAGVGVLKHYNDGRWVLTGVQFSVFGVNGNVEIH